MGNSLEFCRMFRNFPIQTVSVLYTFINYVLIFVTGCLTQRLGRKAVLMYVSAPYTFSWLLITYAPQLGLVYIGRLVSGFCAGICCVAVPAYVVEISTKEIRGLLTSGFQAAFAFGVFTMMALGIVLRWSWLAISGAVVVICGTCMMLLMPESPSWLMRAGHNDKAFDELRFLRGTYNEAVRDFHEIQDYLAEEPKNGLAIHEISLPELYKPMSIAVALMFFQQFVGINSLMAYSVEIFQNYEGFIHPTVAATLVALVQLVATLLSSVLMDKAGRRALYIISGTCIALSLTVSGVFANFSNSRDLLSWSWVPLASFVTYVATFSLGFGPVPYVVTPEMVPCHSRSFLLAVASVASSIFSFVVTKTFEPMRSGLGLAELYWAYAAFAVLGVIFYWIFVPETKGRTIRDIHRQFSVFQN